MIKIKQDAVSTNFEITVVLETIRESYKVASQVKRMLAKSGVATVSVAKQSVVSIEFVSYNDNVSLDDVMWLLVDNLNDDLGIFTESCVDTVSVATNIDGSTIKVSHKNAYRLRDDDEFPYTFAGGLQYFQIFKDTVRIDFQSSHESALQIAQELLDLLDSLD